jgi:integrase
MEAAKAMATEPDAQRRAHPHNRLTPPSVKNMGPGRHADGGGLYLEVDKTGARRWFLRTMVQGRRKDIGLGPVSLVSLSDAREEARRLRKTARAGGDPIAERDKDKRQSMTFEEAARIVWADNIAPNNRNAKHVAQWLSTLEAYTFPTMGKRPVHAVDQADILRALAPIWTEKPETARRVRQRLRAVLDWAYASGHREGVNPVEGVDKALPKQRDRAVHHAAFPWRELPDLVARIAAVDGMGALALRFAILTAARSGEVRGATWAELDMNAKVWTVPADRMKGGREHRVPLSDAAVDVLVAAKAMAGRSDELAFPSRQAARPLSDMTLAAVLKRLSVPVTVHGFRSTFRDWAEEATNFSHEVKEAALAHAIKNRVEAAYRRTDLFDKRTAMMDVWAAHAIHAGAKVVRIGA